MKIIVLRNIWNITWTEPVLNQDSSQ